MNAQVAVMAAGLGIEIVAWRLVATGRGSVWRIMTPTLVAMGVAAFVVRRPVLAVDVSVAAAAAIGIGSGLALYGATRVFVALASMSAGFRRSVEAIYRPAGEVSQRRALVLSLATVAGEELFWRGLFQSRLAEAGAVSAAVLTWLAFVAVNLPSENLPIVASAIAAGAVWAGLAAATGGMLASLLCHAVWTSLMLILPPRPRRPAG